MAAYHFDGGLKVHPFHKYKGFTITAQSKIGAKSGPSVGNEAIKLPNLTHKCLLFSLRDNSICCFADQWLFLCAAVLQWHGFGEDESACRCYQVSERGYQGRSSKPSSPL